MEIVSIVSTMQPGKILEISPQLSKVTYRKLNIRGHNTVEFQKLPISGLCLQIWQKKFLFGEKINYKFQRNLNEALVVENS